MDKILGIISEYNPLHLGHVYHIEKSKEKINPDYTVAVMSGNFTQRGDTAIVDKWSRAEMALKNGVDLVIELPLVYSISSAENYASGSIKILGSLGFDTTLSFGSECGDISKLNDIASVLAIEPPEYISMLNHTLATGSSFPKAREHALLMYLNDIRRYANILSEPNNILGIEYLKAMKRLKAHMNVITVERKGAKYNDTNLHNKFASATAIRHAILSDIDYKKYVPKSTYEILINKVENNQLISGISTFEQAIIYKLRSMSLNEIAMLHDVNEGLENKIKKAADSCNTLPELIDKIKSKRYTRNKN